MQVEELFAKLGLEVDETAFAKAESLLEGLNLKFLAIGGAVAATVGVLVHATNEVRDAGVEAGKAAQRTGMTVEAWQELKAAAHVSGVETEQLETSLKMMARAAFNAEDGGAGVTEAYRKLGVHVKDTNGKVKSSDQLLMDLADGFHGMPDGIEKVALAQRAFGRSGADLLPFLNKGSEGIQELRDHAHALGLVLDTETIAAAKEWKQSMLEFGETVEGLKYRIGSSLLRAFVATKKKASEFFAVIGNGMKAVAKHWVAFAPLVTALAGLLLFKLGGALLLNTGLMTTLTALTTAWGRAALLSGVYNAGAAVLAAAPWLFLLGIIGLVTEDIYRALTGGRSVFGEWVKFLEYNPGESPWLHELKRELKMLTDIQGALQNIVRLKNALTETMITMAGYYAKTGDAVGAAKIGLANGLTLGQSAIGGMDDKGLNVAQPLITMQSLMQHPSVPPMLARSAGATGAAGGMNIGSLSITTGSGDPKEIQTAVQKGLQDFWQQQMSVAHGGVD